MVRASDVAALLSLVVGCAVGEEVEEEDAISVAARRLVPLLASPSLSSSRFLSSPFFPNQLNPSWRPTRPPSTTSLSS